MSTGPGASTLARDVSRWWPVIVLPAIIAALAAVVSVGAKEPSYRAVTKLVTVPLAQWDETFLGTSLVRDGGNPTVTAATLAEGVGSPRVLRMTADELGGRWTPAAVDRAVTVAAVPETNLIEITATASDRDVARRVSRRFADAVLDDRWDTISDELDDRIAALTMIRLADPDAGEAATRVQTLEAIRSSGADPTLRIHAVERATEEDGGVPGIVLVAFAGLGGAAIGLLCALAAAQARRRRSAAPGEPSEPDDGTSTDTDASADTDGDGDGDGDDDEMAAAEG